MPLTQSDLLRRRCRAALARHRKRAAAVGVGLDYDLGDLIALARSPKGELCAYCSRPLDFTFEFDHLCPTSRSGSHSLANLCCCCPECNQLKGGLTAFEFRQLLAFIDQLHPIAQHDLLRRLRYGGRGYSKRGRGRT